MLKQLFERCVRNGIVKQVDLLIHQANTTQEDNRRVFLKDGKPFCSIRYYQYTELIPDLPILYHLFSGKFKFLPKDVISQLGKAPQDKQFLSTHGHYVLSVLACVYKYQGLTQQLIKKLSRLWGYELWNTEGRTHYEKFKSGKSISNTALKNALDYLCKQGVVFIVQGKQKNRHHYFADPFKSVVYALALVSWKYYRIPRKERKSIIKQWKYLMRDIAKDPELWKLCHTAEPDYIKCITLFNRVRKNEICQNCILLGLVERLKPLDNGLGEGEVCSRCGRVYDKVIHPISTGDKAESGYTVDFNKDDKLSEAIGAREGNDNFNDKKKLYAKPRNRYPKCKRCSRNVIEGEYCRSCEEMLRSTRVTLSFPRRAIF